MKAVMRSCTSRAFSSMASLFYHAVSRLSTAKGEHTHKPPKMKYSLLVVAHSSPPPPTSIALFSFSCAPLSLSPQFQFPSRWKVYTPAVKAGGREDGEAGREGEDTCWLTLGAVVRQTWQVRLVVAKDTRRVAFSIAPQDSGRNRRERKREMKEKEWRGRQRREIVSCL